jgi:drug/metabolite transporter (DMT)-like permease
VARGAELEGRGETPLPAVAAVPWPAYGGLLLAVCFWGASFIATKVALRSLSPLAVVAVRFTLGTAVLATAAGVRRQLVLLPPRELGIFALLGAFGITFHQWLQSTALLTARATTSAWIVATTPVFIAVLGATVLRERFGPRQATGLLLAGAGALAVVTDGDWAAVGAGRIGGTGDWLVLASAGVWAVFSVISKPVLKRRPAGLAMLYVMGFGWLFALIVAGATHASGDLLRLPPEAWLALGFLGVFCSGISYVLWYGGLERIQASRVGTFLYLEPVVTAVVAASILGEQTTLYTWLGGAAIVAGVWLVNR